MTDFLRKLIKEIKYNRYVCKKNESMTPYCSFANEPDGYGYHNVVNTYNLYLVNSVGKHINTCTYITTKDIYFKI